MNTTKKYLRRSLFTSLFALSWVRRFQVISERPKKCQKQKAPQFIPTCSAYSSNCLLLLGFCLLLVATQWQFSLIAKLPATFGKCFTPNLVIAIILLHSCRDASPKNLLKRNYLNCFCKLDFPSSYIFGGTWWFSKYRWIHPQKPFSSEQQGCLHFGEVSANSFLFSEVSLLNYKYWNESKKFPQL